MLWLLVLTALGAVVISLNPPAGGPDGTAFNPLVYTMDLLIPIVDIGHERAFGVSGRAQWLAYVLTAMGWILFTAVAGALTRTVHRS
ncbi:hypothetical protein [Micromonospora sp. RP3T]|uniref:hypothetical protein n=1 Tax=Micromonospora sp. RP3T TaxID=2135446 RepID=UPI0011B2909A|nr:hypothetical protein [Micromonospora sp. RP3T]